MSRNTLYLVATLAGLIIVVLVMAPRKTAKEAEQPASVTASPVNGLVTAPEEHAQPATATQATTPPPHTGVTPATVMPALPPHTPVDDVPSTAEVPAEPPAQGR